VLSCKDKRHSLCDGRPFGFAQGDILPTVMMTGSQVSFWAQRRIWIVTLTCATRHYCATAHGAVHLSGHRIRVRLLLVHCNSPFRSITCWISSGDLLPCINLAAI